MGIRGLLEATYQARMTVYTRAFQEREGRMTQVEIVALRDVPCAVSWGGNFRKRGDSIKQSNFPEIREEARIFAAPNLRIPPGSRIVVTDCGVVKNFISSGDGIVYPTHQEIIVAREEMA